MLRILYLVETPGQFTELRRLAGLVVGARPVEQFFLVHDCGPKTGTILTQLAAMGARCLNLAEDRSSGSHRGRVAMLPGWLRAFLRDARDLGRLPVFVQHYQRLLRHKAIDLAVVAEDNVGGRSRALVAAAHRTNTPVLLLPYTFPNPEETAATLGRLSAHQIRRFDQRLFATVRPRWRRPGVPHDLLRLPMTHALALDVTGLTPNNPWVMNCGPAIVAAESVAMARQYRALGCAPDSVVLTGSPADETLATALAERDRRRTEINRRYGLSERPLLLCALPPDQLTTRMADGEFDLFDALLQGWTEALTAVVERFAVLVRPHPRLTCSALLPLREAGIAIADEDTAELIPLCDLYVASLSATIRWAIACGRPVISFDVYQYRYSDYRAVPGVVTVNNMQQFRRILRDIASNPAKLTALASAQAGVAAEWGCLDGRSDERILGLVDRLVGRS